MGHIAKARLQALRVQFEAKFQEVHDNTPAWAAELSTEIPSDAEANLYGWIENDLDLREWVGERDLQVLEEKDYRLQNKHWEGSVRLNRDKIADDKLGLFSTVTLPMFAQRVAKWHDRKLADILLNNVTAFDGLPYFDVAGAVRTYTNSGNLTLGADGISFAATRAAMRSFVDSMGVPRFIGSEFTLVTGPALERTARLICDSEFNSYGVVGTDGAAHATNVQKGLAKPLVIEELSANPNRWFLFATGLPVKGLIVQNRSTPEMVVLDDPNAGGPPFTSNENVYGVDFRSAYGVSFPWLAYANDPDGAMT